MRLSEWMEGAGSQGVRQGNRGGGDRAGLYHTEQGREEYRCPCSYSL